jgi:hypothetical protein
MHYVVEYSYPSSSLCSFMSVRAIYVLVFVWCLIGCLIHLRNSFLCPISRLWYMIECLQKNINEEFEQNTRRCLHTDLGFWNTISYIKQCARAIAQAVSRWLPTTAVRGSKPDLGMGDLWWDKVVLGQVFSEYFGFPCNHRSLHQLLHNHPHVSSGEVQ